MDLRISHKIMTSIFIDTSTFLAFLRKKDINHNRAVDTLDKIVHQDFKVIITDYILDETYTGLLTRVSFQAAMQFDKLLRTGSWKIELITAERFAKAQEVFRRYNKDKTWSFTDCTSWVVMKELKIKKVFTFDKNFEQMGFELLNNLSWW